MRGPRLLRRARTAAGLEPPTETLIWPGLRPSRTVPAIETQTLRYDAHKHSVSRRANHARARERRTRTHAPISVSARPGIEPGRGASPRAIVIMTAREMQLPWRTRRQSFQLPRSTGRRELLCGARELVVEFHIYDTDLGLGHDLEHELGRGRAPTGRHENLRPSVFNIGG